MTANRAYGAARDTKGAGTAWLILAVLVLFSIAAPLNQFKVPPIMPLLLEALGLSVSGGGLLMSVYAISGLLLALPAGLVYQKVGLRWTGILAGGSIVVGTVLGAVSQSMGLLLASRVIEGAGTSFMAVLAPAIIAQWFPVRQRATAMGIWAVWVPVGTVVMQLLAPALAQSLGWRSVWWFGTGYALLTTLLYLVVVRPAPVREARPTAAAGPGVTMGQVLRNREIWLLAAAFAALNAAVIGMSTFLPTFLTTEHGLTLSQAALVASITTIIVIFSLPAGGLLSDRIGSRKKLYVTGLAAMIVLLPLVGVLSVGWMVAILVMVGLVNGAVPTTVFAAAVESAGDERLGGAAMAVIMVGQNAGALLGPLVFGTLVESSGWLTAFVSLGAMLALGVWAAWRTRVR